MVRKFNSMKKEREREKNVNTRVTRLDFTSWMAKTSHTWNAIRWNMSLLWRAVFQVCPTVDGSISSDRDLISGFRSHVFKEFFFLLLFALCAAHVFRYYLLITIFCTFRWRADKVSDAYWVRDRLTWVIVSNNEWLNALVRIVVCVCARLPAIEWNPNLSSRFVITIAIDWVGIERCSYETSNYLLWANVPFNVYRYIHHTVRTTKRVTYGAEMAFKIAINWNEIDFFLFHSNRR